MSKINVFVHIFQDIFQCYKMKEKNPLLILLILHKENSNPVYIIYVPENNEG